MYDTIKIVLAVHYLLTFSFSLSAQYLYHPQHKAYRG